MKVHGKHAPGFVFWIKERTFEGKKDLFLSLFVLDARMMMMMVHIFSNKNKKKRLSMWEDALQLVE